MLVQNKGKYIRHFGSIMIIPGGNELNEEQEKEFSKEMKQPLNAVLLDKEIFVVGGLSTSSFIDLNKEEALELISDTFDLALLSKFAEDEKGKGNKARKSLISAIENQIESIKNPPEDSVVKTED